MKEKKLYKLKDAYSGEKWYFDTVEELKKFADDYTVECEGDWMPIYRIFDQEKGTYRLMTAREEKEALLPY